MKAKTALAIAAASALAGLSAGLSGCAASHEIQEDHWNLASVPGRVTYHLTGYEGPEDGSLTGFIIADVSSIGHTLTRHFLNHNSENPNQGKTRYQLHRAPRPPRESEFRVENERAPRRVFD